MKNQLQFILYQAEENEEYDYAVDASPIVDIVAECMMP
jgi:hypothetical protein